MYECMSACVLGGQTVANRNGGDGDGIIVIDFGCVNSETTESAVQPRAAKERVTKTRNIYPTLLISFLKTELDTLGPSFLSLWACSVLEKGHLNLANSWCDVGHNPRTEEQTVARRDDRQPTTTNFKQRNRKEDEANVAVLSYII